MRFYPVFPCTSIPLFPSRSSLIVLPLFFTFCFVRPPFPAVLSSLCLVFLSIPSSYTNFCKVSSSRYTALHKRPFALSVILSVRSILSVWQIFLALFSAHRRFAIVVPSLRLLVHWVVRLFAVQVCASSRFPPSCPRSACWFGRCPRLPLIFSSLRCPGMRSCTNGLLFFRYHIDSFDSNRSADFPRSC